MTGDYQRLPAMTENEILREAGGLLKKTMVRMAVSGPGPESQGLGGPRVEPQARPYTFCRDSKSSETPKFSHADLRQSVGDQITEGIGGIVATNAILV